jgi:predicted GIY-YIG superfamily endonuclease
VTANLPRRVWEHKNDLLPGFTKRHQVHDLVYFEMHDRIETAIQRERNMKHWRREWKTALVDGNEPGVGRSLSHHHVMQRTRLGGRVDPRITSGDGHDD